MAALAATRASAPWETKRTGADIAQVGATGVFDGYASLFGVADLGRDVVAHGAFAASLARRSASGVKMLWQHEASQPIGRWLSITEDARGLHVRGQLNLAVACAREVFALMRDGAVDGLSIGFRTQDAVTDRKTGLRQLRKIDLWEISVVTFPMLPQARVTMVKRAPRADTFETLRRDLSVLRWRKDALAFDIALQRGAVLESR